jgi:hypothetical protein
MYSHACSCFELITDPELSSLCVGVVLGNGVVNLCFKVRALDRRKFFRLRRNTDADRQHNCHRENNSFELVHQIAPLSVQTTFHHTEAAPDFANNVLTDQRLVNQSILAFTYYRLPPRQATS